MSGQYEDEVNFMMRRLRLNFYRAEDMLLIYKRKQWAVILFRKRFQHPLISFLGGRCRI